MMDIAFLLPSVSPLPSLDSLVFFFFDLFFFFLLTTPQIARERYRSDATIRDMSDREQVNRLPSKRAKILVESKQIVASFRDITFLTNKTYSFLRMWDLALLNEKSHEK